MSLVNNNDSLYLTIFTSLLHVGFDWVNDNYLIFKKTKNHHAKLKFMLAPQCPPHFFILESPLSTGNKLQVIF